MVVRLWVETVGVAVVWHDGPVSLRLRPWLAWGAVHARRHTCSGRVEHSSTRESGVRRKNFETFFGDIMPGQRADGLRILGIFPRIFRFGVALLLITSA